MGSAQSNPAGVDLSKVLTPELFDAVRKVHIPWPHDGPLDFTAVAEQYFGSAAGQSDAYKFTFNQALKPISTIGVENVPDLMQFLPPPEAKDFPAQALGLLVLLDQAPRAIFVGINERYTYGYFDQLTVKLARRLLELPASLSPYSVQRLVEQGWSFDYAIVALIWLTAPLVHSESVEDHKRQTLISEELRKAVEQHTGTKDPHRATQEEDAKDIYAFERLVTGPPKWEETKLEDFMYWLLRVFRVHTPIVERFGRYPYRNNTLGRVSTEEEEQYLKDTNFFAVLLDEEVVKKIRQDVEEGKWSPLEDQAELEGL